MLDLRNKHVLITGASSGIGAAIAEEYAKHGAELHLVARRLDKLQAVGEQLKQRYSCDFHAIQADLADVEAPKDIFKAVKASGHDIDILVNNAGYGVPGKYLSVDWQTHADFNQVMITAVMHLTHLFLPTMVEHGYGRIVNIASLAGHMPGSVGHTAYAAVKHWMLPFTESLHFEYSNKGVHSTAVCPGFTYSEFHDVTGTRDQVSKLSKRMWMSASEVAEQALAASERGDIVYINGKLNSLIAGVVKFMPRKLQYAIMQKQSRKFRRAD